jgi:uncharacterized protein Yka (UPF0111/DUF47 family)
MDRDDIHRLISRMDDVLDLMQDAAESLSLYDVHAGDRLCGRARPAAAELLRAAAGRRGAALQHEERAEILRHLPRDRQPWSPTPTA